MNMSVDLILPLMTLPADAIPSPSSWCSFFSSIFRLLVVCHAELIKRCPLAPGDVHHPPLPAPWPWCELSSQLRGGRRDGGKPNVKVVVNEKWRLWLFFHYFFCKAFSFSMAWTCTSWFYPQRVFFPFLSCSNTPCTVLIIALKGPDVQTSFPQVQN